MNVHALDLPEGSDDVYEWHGFVEDMLSCSEFDFAFDTLAGISENIEEYENITEGQKEAVINIYESVIRRIR